MIADSVMPSAPFRRDRSWFEVLAILLSMCAFCALMLALVETSWLFFTDPLPDAWGAFTWCWQRAFAAVAALLATLALCTRWLPQRQSLRWVGLSLAIVSAGALGWVAEDGLTLLLSGEHISAGERPYMLHTMFVLAPLVGVLGETAPRSLRAAALVARGRVESHPSSRANSRPAACRSCRHRSNRTSCSTRSPTCGASCAPDRPRRSCNARRPDALPRERAAVDARGQLDALA